MRETIHHPDPADEHFFEEGCHILESWNREADGDCSIARARVAPGDTTRWHRLQGVIERYLVIEGEGRVEVGDEKPEPVGPGDVVVIPPAVRQRITNTGDRDLLFYAICTPRFTPECYQDLEATPGKTPETDLEEDLLRRLEAHPDGISEYELLECLRREQHPVTAIETSDHDQHRLFQEHFRLFHLLYRLRDRCRREGRADLEIGALRIRVLPHAGGDSTLPGHPDPLREYYLDWNNLTGTDGAGVDEMLGRFWVRLQGIEEREDALRALGLAADASFEQARERYRRLAMEHHPDRGGDQERLQAINAAMDTLARAHGRTRR